MRRRTALGFVLLALSCSPGPPPRPDAERPALDIFVAAASNTPGGVWTSGWMPPATQVSVPPSAGGWNEHAYIAGGYLDVDPSVLPAGTQRGRLIGYDGERTFTTLCRTDFVPRAVIGTPGHVRVAGDTGAVVDYDAATGACSATAPVDAAVTLSGGAAGDGAVFWVGRQGERGVVFEQREGSPMVVDLGVSPPIPPLLAITYDPTVGFWAVGESGAILRRAVGATNWQVGTALTTDTLRAVSSESRSIKRWTMSVGGSSVPTILSWNSVETTWAVRPSGGLLTAGLTGVFVRSDREVYFVGSGGLTAFFNGGTYWTPPQNVTTEDLLFVISDSGLVISGGGNTADHSAAQHGVLLVRGASHAEYVLDGQTYVGLGRIRLEFGGLGEGGQ